MKNPAYMEVHQHNKTACQKSGQMVFFSQAVVSFCIELFCVVTLQYQILVRIAIAYFIIEKKKAAPQPWQAIAQRFCSTRIEISCIPRDLIIVIFYYQISLKPLKTLSLSQVSFPLLFPLYYIVPPVFTNSDKGKYKGKKIL